MSTCIVPTVPQVTRFTLLDGCGRPRYGPCSQFVTDSFTQVEIATEIEEGESFTATKANGGTCVDTRNPDRVRWDQWTWDFCQVDPELFASVNDKYRILHDFLGGVSGWAEGYDLNSSNSVAVETWVNVSADAIDLCENPDVEAEGAWLYLLAPKLINFRRGEEWTLSNEFNPIQLTAITAKGVRWGKGPYDIELNDFNEPGPLIEPAQPNDRLLAKVVTVKPPEPFCGCQPVSNPDAPALHIECDDPGGQRKRVCASIDAQEDYPGADWQIAWGDGQQEPIAAGQRLCHTYVEDGDYFVSVVDLNRRNNYRALKVEVPCCMRLTVDPLRCEAPCSVTATVTGAAKEPTFEW